MAPIAFDALIGRADVARDERRWLINSIRAEIWNVNLDHEKHPEMLTAADFTPLTGAQIAEREREEKREPTADELAAYKARLFAAFPGKQNA